MMTFEIRNHGHNISGIKRRPRAARPDEGGRSGTAALTGSGPELPVLSDNQRSVLPVRRRAGPAFAIEMKDDARLTERLLRS